MVSREYSILAQKISSLLYPFLELVLSGNTPSSLSPNAILAGQVWEIIKRFVMDKPELVARLDELSFLADKDSAVDLLSKELETSLPSLSAADLDKLTALVEANFLQDNSVQDISSIPDIEKTPTPRIWWPEPEISGAEPDEEPIMRSIPSLGSRYLRAEISDSDHSKPLPLDQEFTIAFWVDLESGGAYDASVPFDDTRAFLPDESMAQLQVIINSQDFIIHTRTPQELRVPREGISRNKARFDLEPKREGLGEVVALFYKDNNFLQGMILQINVATGERAFVGKPAILGRPLDGLVGLHPRDVLLFIKKVTDGFQLTMVGSVASQAYLPLSPEALNEKITKARQALLEVVYLAQGPNGLFVHPAGKAIPAGASLPFQFGIDIPLEINNLAVKKLAQAGWLLYDGIFYGEGTRADAHEMGDQLRKLANESTLKLQIVSEEFFMPWGLLYLAEIVDPDHINPELFLGMSHIIEHIPLQNRMQVHDERISSHPELGVSLNLDTRIDQAFKINVIAEQQSFWDQLAADQQVVLKVRETSEDFKNGLNQAAEQILYFYGHAESKALNEGAGSGSSSLSFSDNQNVSLDDLRVSSSTRLLFENQPLIFLNACESAELSPLFYGGFMPYFIEKGARGMIGTECQVPAIFAAEWAKRFFSRFLFEEQPIGKIFLELRRDFFDRHNNPLGLLYALYCDGDTIVTPGLRIR